MFFQSSNLINSYGSNGSWKNPYVVPAGLVSGREFLIPESGKARLARVQVFQHPYLVRSHHDIKQALAQCGSIITGNPGVKTNKHVELQ
jgi:hypothetical protein